VLWDEKFVYMEGGELRHQKLLASSEPSINIFRFLELFLFLFFFFLGAGSITLWFALQLSTFLEKILYDLIITRTFLCISSSVNIFYQFIYFLMFFFAVETSFVFFDEVGELYDVIKKWHIDKNKSGGGAEAEREHEDEGEDEDEVKSE
jgi:hypothetical protein